MKTFIAILVLGILTAGSLVAGPELFIKDDAFFFGSIPQHSTLVHYFWFKSVGDEDLVITNIKTGCKCVLIPLERDTLPPGDSMQVGVEWTIEKQMFKTGKYPYIFTNASSEPYRIYLTGEVFPGTDSIKPVSCKPYKLALLDHPQKPINEMTFTLTSSANRDLDIVLLSGQPKECEIILPDKINKNSKAVGRVRVREEYIDKEFKTSITILVDPEQNSRLTIPIYRKIY